MITSPFVRHRIAAAALAAITATAWMCGTGYGSPNLSWEKEAIVLTADHGSKTVETSLRFKNNAAHPIRIIDVNPSCGCISAEMTKDTFAPGEEGEILVVFTVGSKSGREEKHIDISTDESDKAAYRVNLAINIPKWIEVEAADLVWAATSKTEKRIIRIWSPLNKSLEITNSNYDNQRLKVEVLAENESASSYLISIQPLSTVENFHESVAFKIRFNELERDFVFYARVK